MRTVLPVIALALAVGRLTGASPNEACLECHSDRTQTMQKGKAEVSIFVDSAELAKSAHDSLKCTDCHEGIDASDVPHKVTPVNCGSCHDDIGTKHAFHHRLGLAPVPKGADTACASCHGSHAVQKVGLASSAFTRERQTESCGKCHESAKAQFLASAHGKALAGSADAPSCLTCHKHAVAVPAAKGELLELKRVQTALCESCHIHKAAVASQALRGNLFVGSYDQSVHGAALKQGKVDAANCVDCHGAHEMNRGLQTGGRMAKVRSAETCAKCHAGIAKEFASSVHASALRKGSPDAPTCTDCHGEHDIRAHTDPTSPVYKANIAQQVCATCHASLKLTSKYGMAPGTFQTFTDSYHGMAVREGSVVVANCASCHSSHAIKSQDDPTSTISKENLVKTCGQCHPGANTRFTVGKVHVSPDSARQKEGSNPVLHLIASAYVLLIVVVVGGMFLHNALDLLKKVRRKLAIHKGLIEEEPVAHRLYLRMTAQERMQHGTLVLSFLVLVVTGFALHYPDSWWVVAVRDLSHRLFDLRGLVHRVAGIVMVAAGVWHMAYLAFTPSGRSLFMALLPNKRDLTDPFGVLRYNLGLSEEKPKFGRFCYIEKAEYWALVWGTILMGLTGLVLWFDNTSMGLLTKLGFDISRTIHFYEAILATLAIIVWHLYFVIFNPDVYPMSLAWLTGRVSEREMLEEHPLELERLKTLELERSKNVPPSPPPAPPKSP